MVLWTAIPFYWMVATSLKYDREIYGFDATLFPQQPTLANYVTILYDTPYLLFLRNSIIVAVGSTILSMIIACLGSYAIARLNFPGRALLARGLVFTYLVPTSLLFIPMFAMMSALRLTDSLHGLTIAYLGFDVPFCTWLLMGYFRSIPVELEEAGLVDGCNRIGVLLRIVLPLALPALVVVTFFSFTHAWNEFLYAHVFTSSDRVRTITTGLANFMTEDVFFWGPLMASTVISALPPVLMFLLLQRWVVQGLTLGGVKG
jgi:multiple sugar transport system permease protein